MGRPKKNGPKRPKLAAIDVSSQDLLATVLKAITDYIISQNLQCGDKLPSERQLAQDLEVTRPVVRSAIKALEIRGLIQVKPGDGTYVSNGDSMTADSIEWGLFLRNQRLMDSIEARKLLEVDIAGLAARNRTQNNLIALQHQIEVMQNSVITDSQYADADLEFHFLIAQASNNAVLQGFSKSLNDLLRVWQARAFRQEGAVNPNKEHIAIFEAIAQKNVRNSKAAMRIHMVNAEKRLRESLV